MSSEGIQVSHNIFRPITVAGVYVCVCVCVCVGGGGGGGALGHYPVAG